MYDNWQSIFKDPPDALSAHSRNCHFPTDSNQETQYSSEAAASAAVNKL
jgi:hypothetical protein